MVYWFLIALVIVTIGGIEQISKASKLAPIGIGLCVISFAVASMLLYFSHTGKL